MTRRGSRRDCPARSSNAQLADLTGIEHLATWGLAVTSGIVYYGFAFWFFVGGLRGIPASVAGSLFPLIPLFGLAAAYVSGDRLSDRQWVGAAIVVTATGVAAIHHLTQDGADPAP